MYKDWKEYTHSNYQYLTVANNSAKANTDENNIMYIY